MLDAAVQRRQRARNILHEALLVACLIATAAGVAWLICGSTGLIWILAVGALFVVLRPRLPVRAVLSAYRAQPLPYAAAPALYDAVGELARRAGLATVPTLFLVPSRVPNAFGAAVATRFSRSPRGSYAPSADGSWSACSHTRSATCAPATPPS